MTQKEIIVQIRKSFNLMLITKIMKAIKTILKEEFTAKYIH